MTTINGTVLDIGRGSMLTREVRLVFELSGPATTTAGVVVPTQRKTVTPNEDDEWSVVLQDTDSMVQYRYYRLSIEWLNGAADSDFPTWQIRLPSGTFLFSDLIAAGYALVGESGVNNAMWWVGDYPDDPPPIPGPLWLDPVTGDFYEYGV